MDRYDRPRQALAIALAALAGYVDAIGFLAAGGYFVAFMSGNTTRLAVNLVVEPTKALVPALLITGFVAGVTGGALVGARAGVRRKPLVLLLTAALLLGGAGARLAGHDAIMLALLVAAMGALNNTFQRDGEVSIGLTYVTGALVRAGQGLAAALGGEPRAGWGTNLLLWSGLAGGAVCGALLESRLPQVAIWLAVAAALAAALFSTKLKA